MVDSILDTIAYALVLLGLVLVSGGQFITHLPGAAKGSKKIKVEKTSMASLGYVCMFAAFILLIIATWAV